MSQNQLTKSRFHAFRHQAGRCYYCSAPMWLGKPGQYAEIHKVSKRDLKRFQCTAEHLVARQDGGSETLNNIVAACLFCNRARHQRQNPPSARSFRDLILRRLEKSKWHPIHLHHILLLPGR